MDNVLKTHTKKLLCCRLLGGSHGLLNVEDVKKIKTGSMAYSKHIVGVNYAFVILLGTSKMIDEPTSRCFSIILNQCSTFCFPFILRQNKSNHYTHQIRSSSNTVSTIRVKFAAASQRQIWAARAIEPAKTYRTTCKFHQVYSNTAVFELLIISCSQPPASMQWQWPHHCHSDSSLRSPLKEVQ